MNVLVSLALYNPLEAFILIRFCDIFTKRYFQKNDFIHCYILGIINLMFQNFRTIFTNPMYILVYDTFVMFVPMILLLFIYYNSIICCNNRRTCVSIQVVMLSQVMNFATICLLVNISNNVFGNVFDSNYVSNYYELVVNILLKILQLTIVIIIKNGVMIYEKYFKEVASKIY